MKATLIVDGIQLEVDISEELHAKITHKAETGYERVSNGKTFYCIDSLCRYALAHVETGSQANNGIYDSANYFSNATVAENNAHAERLMRKLRRFAAEHNLIPNPNGTSFEILYDGKDLKSVESLGVTRYFGEIRFNTQMAVDQAIEEFRDELIWYFTEYKDKL